MLPTSHTTSTALSRSEYMAASSSCQDSDQSHRAAEAGFGGTNNKMPRTIPSGLSALILAATAQLGDLIDQENGRSEYAESATLPDGNSTGTTTDDGASSDGEALGHQNMKLKAGSNTTPLMVPEQAPDAAPNQGAGLPEILMSLALDPKNENTIAFLPDGKYFALRAQKFANDLMPQYFDNCQTFEDFLAMLHDWGFSRILRHEDEDVQHNSAGSRRMSGLSTASAVTVSTIEVFRHPKFVRGDIKLCLTIRFGESPTTARLSALPNSGAIFEYNTAAAPAPATAASLSTSPESGDSATFPSGMAMAKRRLSPNSTSIGRRDSDLISASSSVQHQPNHKSKRLSLDGNESCSNLSRSDEIRSVALALTAEKLNLQGGSSMDIAPSAPEVAGTGGSSSAAIGNSIAPLVDQAVASATHTIVTDAIETLLNDEFHTKETYMKHSQELSRSSLPGVVPISKQLFEVGPPSITTMGGNSRTGSLAGEDLEVSAVAALAAVAAQQERLVVADETAAEN